MSWIGRKPSSEKSVELLSSAINGISRDYLNFFLHSNGGEGPISKNPYWIILDPVEEVLKQARDNRVSLLPGFLMIGTNGGGEMILLDLGSTDAIYALPYINSGSSDLLLIAPTFREFEHLLQEPETPTFIESIMQKFFTTGIKPNLARIEYTLWKQTELEAKNKEYEIERYAPEFHAIGETDPGYFLGVSKKDQSVWSVPFLGTEHLPARKLAPSLEAMLSDHHRRR